LIQLELGLGLVNKHKNKKSSRWKEIYDLIQHLNKAKRETNKAILDLSPEN